MPGLPWSGVTLEEDDVKSAAPCEAGIHFEEPFRLVPSQIVVSDVKNVDMSFTDWLTHVCGCWTHTQWHADTHKHAHKVSVSFSLSWCSFNVFVCVFVCVFVRAFDRVLLVSLALSVSLSVPLSVFSSVSLSMSESAIVCVCFAGLVALLSYAHLNVYLVEAKECTETSSNEGNNSICLPATCTCCAFDADDVFSTCSIREEDERMTHDPAHVYNNRCRGAHTLCSWCLQHL